METLLKVYGIVHLVMTTTSIILNTILIIRYLSKELDNNGSIQSATFFDSFNMWLAYAIVSFLPIVNFYYNIKVPLELKGIVK